MSANSVAESGAAPTDQGSAPRVTADRLARWSFLAALLVIVSASAYVLWRERGWLPTADYAYNQLEVTGFPGRLPLVGAWSRNGWDHPGPAMFYLSLIPWRLLGGASVGFLLTAILIHLSGVLLAWFAAARRSVSAAVAIVCAMLLVWAVCAPGAAWNFWNPFISLMLSGALMALAWDAAGRGSLGSFAILPLGAVMAQSHLGAALLVVLLTGTAFLMAVIRRGHPAERRVPWRWWAGGALIAAVMWIPPVVQQIWGPGPGNLGLILTTDLPPGFGLRQGLRTALDTFAVPPYWWNPGDLRLLPSSLSIPWLLVFPLAAVVVVAVRSRRADHVRFLVLGGVSFVALVASIARISDPFSYLVTWGPTVSMVLVAGSIWIVLDAMGDARWLSWAAPALLVVPAVGLAVNLVSNPAPNSDTHDQIEAVVGFARADPDHGVYVSEWPRASSAPRTWSQTTMDQVGLTLPGIAAVLQEEEVPVAVYVNPAIPSQRAKNLLPSDPRGKIPVVLRPLVTGPQDVPKGWRVVAESDPFTPDEWARLNAEARIADDPGSSPTDRIFAIERFEGVRANRLAWQLLTPDSRSAS